MTAEVFKEPSALARRDRGPANMHTELRMLLQVMAVVVVLKETSLEEVDLCRTHLIPLVYDSFSLMIW